MQVAEVRRGLNLCPGETAFLAAQKVHVRNNFAKYLGLDPVQVHPDDVPMVGFGSSGGGYRAMIGCLSYSEEMKRTGLWDILTYFAGVSGSCRALAAYYTFGDGSMAKIIEHCKKQLSPYHPYQQKLSAWCSLSLTASMSLLAHWWKSTEVVCTLSRWIYTRFLPLDTCFSTMTHVTHLSSRVLRATL